MSGGLMCFLAGVVFGYFILSQLYVDIPWKPRYYEVAATTQETIRNVPAASAFTKKDDIFDRCVLVENDPWDEEILDIATPSFDPLRNCNRSYVPLTILEDGILRVSDNSSGSVAYTCRGRCVNLIDDYHYSGGSWEELPHLFECDIVEAECRNDTTKIYNFLHTQVVSITNAEAKESSSRPYRPNVHIVLFDSVADTQSMRSFPNTIAYIQETFGSIRFRHMNKVGDNSRPNGVAFMLGKRAYSVDKKIFGVPSLKSQFSYEMSCEKPLEKKNLTSLIFNLFEEGGYRTMMAEDWSKGVFNYPKCTGFREKPTDHYMRPFQLRYFDAEDKHSLIRKAMSMDNCMEHHQFLLSYLEQFIHAYPDEPKFSLTWMSYLSHDDPDVIYHADDYVKAFFERNKEEFDKSFVFLMGDHGLRFGKQRDTRLGKIEVNNPMLHLIIPRELRDKPDLKAVLNDNSMKLLTMYDLHATFKDIIIYQHLSNFTDTSYVPIPADTEGSSLLRELNPSLPRNCRELPIPFDYCPCKFEFERISEDTTLLSMGEWVIGKMNEELAKAGVENDCALLHLEGVPIVDGFVPVNETNLFTMTFFATPGGGKFEALLRTSSPGNASTYALASPYFNRLNAYGRTADCITKAPQRPLCFCRNLLP